MNGENMQITEEGCVIHKSVEFVESKHGHSLWICKDCNHEFYEAEEAHGG